MNKTSVSEKAIQNSRKENNEIKTKSITRSLAIFAVMTIAGVSLVVFGQDAALAAVRNTLPLLGAAMFASALTFFMVDLTR